MVEKGDYNFSIPIMYNRLALSERGRERERERELDREHRRGDRDDRITYQLHELRA